VGDFNASAPSKVIQSILFAGWKDSYVEVHGEGEPGATVHSFKGEDDPKKDVRKKIDFIFTKGNVTAVDSKIIKDSYRGIYPSDHYFVEAVLRCD
ncbi:MAG TPA: endonuclease, partial [Sphingobacterium sp.]|nr:endonuclease [Sphingobacterium sp.]